MTEISAELRRAVEGALSLSLNQSIRVTDARAVSGGCINAGMRLALSDGGKCFLKYNASAPDGMFECEEEGLRVLAEGGEVRVPRPLALGGGDEAGQDNTPSFLVMEFIESAAPRNDTAQTLGRGLAALHRREAPQFGFDSDNYIGAAPQVNPWTDSWSGFFAQSRIGIQLRLLERRGYATADLQSRVAKLIEKMDERLGRRNPRPSLLHGDLWSGNVMTDEQGAPVLIDPAVYYGDREADIAMTELFGRFDPQFYGAYKEVWPLDEGYAERRDLYNLYHLMNHLGLFGLSYMTGVMDILRRYA